MPWDGTELWVADRRRRRARHGARGRGRPRRIDLPAELVARRRAALRLRPQRLVEPVPRARRAAIERCTRWRPSSASRNGCSACRPTASTAAAASSAPSRQGGRRAWRSSTGRRRRGSTEIERRSAPSTSCMSAGLRFFSAARRDRARTVVAARPRHGRCETVLRRSTEALPAAFMSVAEAIEFPTEGDLTSHAFYYPPRTATSAVRRASARR